MRRSDQRRDAVFACYQRDVTGRPLEELLGADVRPFTRELAEGVERLRPELDATIAELAKGWTIDRIAPLERNIMRVALYEIEHREEIPTEVAIDEAVELAKEYCGAEAPGSASSSSPPRRRPQASSRRCATRCWPAASGSGPFSRSRPVVPSVPTRSRCSPPPRRSS